MSTRKAASLASNPLSKKKLQKTEKREKLVIDPELEPELTSKTNFLSKD